MEQLNWLERPVKPAVTVVVDGLYCRNAPIRCLGSATLCCNGLWRCLADVAGCLAVIEVRISPADSNSPDILASL